MRPHHGFHASPYRTIGDVEYATAGWVDWYNNRRLHGTLGMMTLVEFQQAHYAALNREPQPVQERQKTRGGSRCPRQAAVCGNAQGHAHEGWIAAPEHHRLPWSPSSAPSGRSRSFW